VAAITMSAKGFSISAECIYMLPNTEYVEILIHPKERLLSIRKSDSSNRNAIPWKTGYISSAAFMPVLYDLCGWYGEWKYRALAICLTKKKERVILFDLAETETIVYDTTRDSEGNITERLSHKYLPSSWRDNFGTTIRDSFSFCRRRLAESLPKWNTAAPALPVDGYENTVEPPDSERVQAVLREMRA